jgi:hypothetical protein
LYGGANAASGLGEDFDRQALHALALAITHPRGGERLEFTAPLPLDFAAYFAARGLDTSAGAISKWVQEE